MSRRFYQLDLPALEEIRKGMGADAHREQL